MAAVKLDVAMRTDRGVMRESNEDAVGGDLEAGLLILADGMGGANAGEVASALAVDLLLNQLAKREESTAVLQPEGLLDALQGVNIAILDLAQRVPEYQGMGTTLVVGLFQPGKLIYTHVGDSRLYRFRDGRLEAMTTDHTLIQELVRLKEFQSVQEAIAAGVPQNILSRAFGSGSEVEIDLVETVCGPDDLFLFCSDGLTNMLSDEEIEAVLKTVDDSLQTKVDGLIESACEHGGMDNVSVILARVIEQ